MNVLFIGGTGIISTAVSRLAVSQGIDLYLLNRGLRCANLPGSRTLMCDINKPEEARAVLQGKTFDVVVDWIAYTPADIERDVALFLGRVKQFVFISSAAAYQKPPVNYRITESTPLDNPYWEYARDKIACEKRLMRAFHEDGFPFTIVRPSLTYDLNFPFVFGGRGCYTIADRMIREKPVIVHGDGSSLWVVTHAEDFGKGFCGLLGNERALCETFHITTDEVLTWNQVYATIAQALGVEANIVHIPSDFIARVAPQKAGTLLGDKTWSVVFDNSKIKTFVPGFRASLSFAEGIRRTIAWFGLDKNRRRVDDAVNYEIDGIITAYAGGRRYNGHGANAA